MDVVESLQHFAYRFVDGLEEAVPLWIMRDHGVGHDYCLTEELLEGVADEFGSIIMNDIERSWVS